MEWSITSLLIAIGVLAVFYLLKDFNVFKRNGVIHVPAFPIVGSMLPVVLRQISFSEYLQKLYNFQPDAKYCGFYFTTQPIIMMRDQELIKKICIKNFETFPDRRGFSKLNDPLLAKNLFSLEGQRWREVRTLLTPAFTSSKMRTMFTLMSECAIDFTTFLSTLPANESDIDVKNIFSRFTNDVIAACAFGIKIDSMRNQSNKFYVYGKEVTTFAGFRNMKLLFLQTFPRLSHVLNIRIVSEHMESFFKNILASTIATREAENISRPDMIQLMMDIKNTRETEKKLDIDDITAQAFIFFFGGFDTTSTAISFIAHEIAVNPDIQARLRREIDAVLKESNGNVTYDAVNRLEYLNAVINESLRLYPPIIFAERKCQKPFELPPALPGEKPFVLKKGMLVWVPIYAIHRDENYYVEPEKFRPERFLNGEVEHNAFYYLSFGLGPRMCIANRFAMTEIKVLIFYLLALCELKPCAKTIFPMKLSRKNLPIQPEGGFWLNVRPRNDVCPTIIEQTRAK